MKRFASRILLCLLVLPCFAVAAEPTAGPRQIGGMVKDALGRPLGDVSVHLAGR